MTAWPTTFPSHPCPYPDIVLAAIGEALPDRGVFLDPMCGAGRCFELERPGRLVVGTEIEPEFAGLHDRTIVADASSLPFGIGVFTGGFCSPSYPNRMNGDYTNPGWTTNPEGRRNYSLSKRWLARDEAAVLHSNNTACYSARRDVDTYWALHRRIWREVARVIRPGGLFVLNAKDVVGVPVTDGHVALLVGGGFVEERRIEVSPPGYRRGAHREVRVDHEDIVVLRRGGK